MSKYKTLRRYRRRKLDQQRIVIFLRQYHPMLRTDRLLYQNLLAHSVQDYQSLQCVERILTWYLGLLLAQQFRQRNLDCLARHRHLCLAMIPTLDNHPHNRRAAQVGQ